MPMTPELLIDKIVEIMPRSLPRYKCKVVAEDILKVVLRAIMEDEIVALKWGMKKGSRCLLVLTTSFEEFLNEKR